MLNLNFATTKRLRGAEISDIKTDFLEQRYCLQHVKVGI